MGSRRQESASWRRGYQVWCHKKKMSSGGLNFSMHWRGEVVGRSISPSPGSLKALHAGVLPTVFLLQLWRELRMVLKEGSERPLAAGKREESQQISLLVRCLFGWRAECQNGWAVWVLCSGKGGVWPIRMVEVPLRAVVPLTPQSKSLSVAGKASLQPAPGLRTGAIRASVHKPGFLLPFINCTGIYMKLALMEVPMQLLCPVSHPGAKQSFAAALWLEAKGCFTFPSSSFFMSTHPLHLAVMH